MIPAGRLVMRDTNIIVYLARGGAAGRSSALANRSASRQKGDGGPRKATVSRCLHSTGLSAAGLRNRPNWNTW